MFLTHLQRLVPDLGHVSHRERLRAGLGAAFGLFLTAMVTRLCLGDAASVPLLIAPMGASSVLLFGVPSSPLAQPWSIIGGNTLAAIVGVSFRLLVPDPYAAAALAVGTAIVAMFVLRCIHPPAGAVAITAVLGGPVIDGLGYGFVVAPVMLNSALLLAAALAYNTATRHRYPHLRPAASAAMPLPDPATDRVSFCLADIDAVLRSLDEMVDIDRGDLAAILHAAELRAVRRRFGAQAAARHASTAPRLAESRGRRARARLPVENEERSVGGGSDRARLGDRDG